MNKFQEELVVSNDKLVHFCVRKMMVNSMKKYEYDDLVQVGRIGLIKAAKTYKGSVKFSTYAARCINNELYMHFRKENKKIDCISLEGHITVDFDAYEAPLIDIIEAPNSDFSNMVSDLYDIEKVFNIVLNTFDTREILIWLYSIYGGNQKELAKELNITQPYISKLKYKIYSKVNRILEQNIDFDEEYYIKIDTNNCSLSFTVEDCGKAEFLVSDLLKKIQGGSRATITRKFENISIVFSNIEEALPIIALIVESISKYSIKLIKN